MQLASFLGTGEHGRFLPSMDSCDILPYFGTFLHHCCTILLHHCSGVFVTNLAPNFSTAPCYYAEATLAPYYTTAATSTPVSTYTMLASYYYASAPASHYTTSAPYMRTYSAQAATQRLQRTIYSKKIIFICMLRTVLKS